MTSAVRTLRLRSLALAGWALIATSAAAQNTIAQATDAAPQSFAIHGQATVIDQANLAFASPYAGTNSLPAKAEGRET
ncbi:MAG: hypothetical protein ABI306_07140, partial [Caulobacteraceae bacterium]